MKKLFFTAILLTALAASNAFAQSTPLFQKVAGKWRGTLEYLDYSDEKSRVTLKTEIEFKPSADGNSADVLTIYDDFGKVMKDRSTQRIDLTEKKYFDGKS